MGDFRKSTIYQIYVRSFADLNGDGVGDIRGITEKIPYLADLGVDYIWTTPFYRSPMNDNGYDVADYMSVDPVFGTMGDVEELIDKAGEYGIGLMCDMVFNHTSTSHEWFQKALTGDPEYMDYYIFKDPVDGHAPTNWVSKFGGPAWEYVPELGKYYLHLFDVTQADLNWDNSRVREELKEVIRFWKKKGVKGFRFDVVNLISKPDLFTDDLEGDGRRFYTDGPHVHDYLKELVRDTGIDELVTVGEMSSTSLENCVKYTNPDEKELSMVFSFHHLKVDYKDGDKWTLQEPDFDALKHIFAGWQEGMQDHNGWNATFLCNHDQPRAVSRFGNDQKYWKESAKSLAALIHLMRGTPYIYQGEELGTTNAGFGSIDQYRDVESINYHKILRASGKSEEETLNILGARSRDNGRTPMQWDGSRYAGFSGAKPWIGIPENHTYINVEEEKKDPDSILHFYKKLVQLRKEYPVISEGSIEFLDMKNEKVFHFIRRFEDQKLSVFISLSEKEEQMEDPYQLPEDGQILISNYSDCTGRDDKEKQVTELRPFEVLAVFEENK